MASETREDRTMRRDVLGGQVPPLGPSRTRGMLSSGAFKSMILVGLALPLLAAAPSPSQSLQIIADDVAAFGIKLQNLKTAYSSEDAVAGRRPLAARLADAEVLFLLGDFNRASLLLFDIIGRPGVELHPLYNKTLYYLAEAQFQIANDIAARTFFQKLIDRNERERLADAVRRLIEIADRSESWEGLDAYVRVLQRQGRLPPTVAYIHAKSLIRQSNQQLLDAEEPSVAADVAAALRRQAAGALERVAPAIADVPNNHPLWAKAQYLGAIGLLAQGNLEGAHRGFAQLMEVAGNYDAAADLRELSAMNAGRILAELGRRTEAADTYQAIPRSSLYFEEALYEVTWLYVRAAEDANDTTVKADEYGRALRALEIILLSEAENRVAPEARILLGNILLRLKQHVQSEGAFVELVQRYEPLRDALAKMSREVSDPDAYYTEVAERSRAGGSLLPPLVFKWAEAQKGLQRALGVVRDIDEGAQWIEDANRIIEELLTAINADTAAVLFPTLNEAQARLLELENQSVVLATRLLDVERKVVESKLDGATRKQLQALWQERAELEPAYRALPRRKEDYEERLQGMRGRMGETEKSAFRLKWEVEEMRRTLQGIEQWLAENPGALDDETRTSVVERMSQARGEVETLESEQRALEAEVSRERDLITVGSTNQSQEETVRQRYAESLAREQELLSAAANSVGADAKRWIDVITQQRDTISQYHVELTAFRAHLEELVARQSNEIRAVLLREQQALNSFGDTASVVRTDARRVVGEIAIGELQAVDEKFRDIVLRGDVGVIDVAWALKEGQTAAITERVTEQRESLELLDREFKDVVAE